MKKLTSAAEFVASAIAQAHPTTVGLLIMAGTVGGRFIVGKEDENNRWVHHELGGLYEGAQGIAVASAVAPVVVGGLGMLGQVVAARQAGSS